MSNLGLNRKVLSDIANGNQEAIKALERIFSDVNIAMPEEIAAAINQAAQAVAASNQAIGMLAELADILDQLAAAPRVEPTPEFEDLRPAIQVGSIAVQESDNVEITGGTIGLSPGTVALPSFYLGDRATGFYRIALDNWGFSVNGVKLLDIRSQIFQVVGAVSLSAGAVGTPSLHWGDNTTGWYRVGANDLGLSVSGTKRFGVNSTGASVTGTLSATSAVFSGTATSGGGGTFRSYNDTGTVQWVAGILGTAGATSWSLYDAIAGASRITVVAAGGAIAIVGTTTITGGLTVTLNFAGQGTCQISGAFSCNGKTPQTAYALGGAATDLATVLVLANNLRAMAIANGTGS